MTCVPAIAWTLFFFLNFLWDLLWAVHPRHISVLTFSFYLCYFCLDCLFWSKQLTQILVECMTRWEWGGWAPVTVILSMLLGAVQDTSLTGCKVAICISVLWTSLNFRETELHARPHSKQMTGVQDLDSGFWVHLIPQVTGLFLWWVCQRWTLGINLQELCLSSLPLPLGGTGLSLGPRTHQLGWLASGILPSASPMRTAVCYKGSNLHSKHFTDGDISLVSGHRNMGVD